MNNKLHPIAVLDLDTLHLEKGNHDSPEAGMCIMEAVSMLSGEPFSDHPACASPVITAFLMSWNDALNDDDRQQLKRYIPLVIGTRGSEELETRRAWMCTDWMIRVQTPAWLRFAGLETQAQVLEAFHEFKPGADVQPIMPTLLAIKTDAETARDAAWDAAGAATGAAARDAAWDAAGAAARDAARDAAWDAARAAARAAAWDAARDAARDAAWAAAGAAVAKNFAPTVKALQKSAHELVVRMIEAQS